MGRKMDRATKSFDRRMKADERRAATLQGRHDKGQLTEAGIAELDGLQFGMKERRDSFEDFMGKYQEKGLWGTSFGGDDVGYRTEGESKWSRDERSKVGGGPVPEGGDEEFTTSNFGGGREMGIGSNKFDAPEGDRIDRYSSYPQGREFENIAGGGLINLGGREEERFGIGGKKKADLEDSVAATSGGMAGGPPQTSATSIGDESNLERSSDSSVLAPKSRSRGITVGGAESNKFTGGPPKRDNYRMALPDALAQAGLSAEERAARDVTEKQQLIKEKEQALGQNELEQKQMIEKMLAKRRRNKLTEALRETDWK
jgi:hypothetical protein